MSNTIDRKRRASRIRHNLRQVAEQGMPRLTVFRSNSGIYAQIIDDTEGKTLASASTVDKKLAKEIKKATTVEAAEQVGTELAKRAKSAGVEKVYFDRSGFRFIGRVKALADAARAGGLKF